MNNKRRFKNKTINKTMEQYQVNKMASVPEKDALEIRGVFEPSFQGDLAASGPFCTSPKANIHPASGVFFMMERVAYLLVPSQTYVVTIL
jgi:hypothetical protein